MLIPIIIFNTEEVPKYSKDDQEKLYYKNSPIPQPKSKSKEDKQKLVDFCKKICLILHVVNENEFEAATTFITDPFGTGGKGRARRFNLTHVVGMFAGHEVALVKTRPGVDCREDLQSAIKDLRLNHVQYIIAVGVGYSFEPDKHNLGDVLISKEIFPLENYKTEGNKIIPRKGMREMKGDLRHTFCEGIAYWNGKKYKVSENRTSKAYCGIFVSSPELVNSSNKRDQFKEAVPEAIGGEMEGCELLKMKGTEIIIVKGVGDYGDESKARCKVWQFTAAMAAFHFMKTMIEHKGADFSSSNDPSTLGR